MTGTRATRRSGSHATGVMHKVRDLSEGIVAAVPAGAGRDSYEIALNKAAALLALIDGGSLANDLSARKTSDLRVAVVGEILGHALDKAGPIVGTGVGAATSAASNSYQARLDEYWSGGTETDNKLRSEALDVLAELGHQHIPTSVIEASGEGMDDLLRQIIAKYEDTLRWAGMTK